MKNVTAKDIETIRDIKTNILVAEQKLGKFMEADLSVAKVRTDMRNILNSIEKLEVKLSNKLNSLK